MNETRLKKYKKGKKKNFSKMIVGIGVIFSKKAKLVYIFFPISEERVLVGLRRKLSNPIILFPIFPSQPNIPLPHFLSSPFSVIRVHLIWWILGMTEKRGDEMLFRVFGYVNLKNEKLVGPGCAHQNSISQNWGENRRENRNKREGPKSSLELLGIVQRVFHYFVFAFSSLAISVAHLYEFWWAIEKTSKPTILFPIFPSQPNTPLPHFLSSLFSLIKVLLVWWILGMIKKRWAEMLFEMFGWCSPQAHQNVLSPNWGENIREK